MISSILVDIGNTNTKWKFEEEYFILPTENFELDLLPSCSRIWISNVSSNSFKSKKFNVCFVESQVRYKSLTNVYSDPKSLGCDRWLGMIASYELSQGKSFVLVDVGTAITIDIVNNSGAHLGGLIFPGLDKIRQTFDKFSVVSPEHINALGHTTEEAWGNGTIALVVNTINQKIREIKNEKSDISVFITGGGYLSLQNFLEFDHSYHENLVLDGLEFYVNNMG
jgi:type III pantothenate kinase